MSDIENILVAVGRFPQDEVLLARAAEIASMHGAKLTVAHVLEDYSRHGSAAADFALLHSLLLEDARQDIEAAVSRQVADSVETDIRIETGLPAACLIDLSNTLKPALTVMRAHHADSILKKIIGSTTDRVLRATGAPVLVVKRAAKSAYQRVLAATDTSETSTAAIDDVAALFPAIRLDLVHVVQVPHQFESVMLRAGYGETALSAHRDALMRKAWDYMETMSEKLGDRPLPGSASVIEGSPADTIVKMTRSADVQLIALGPGSTNVLQRALLGSVTRRVLRSASCDVLVCPP